MPADEDADWLEDDDDFELAGSTTMLAIQVAGERRGRIGRPVVRLLARNAPPEIDCVECG
ncbi:hypothetical protein D3C83_75790 [compost metagenome]